MKKSMMILWIVAASLIVAGIVLCVLGMALSTKTLHFGEAIKLFGKREVVTNEHVISEPISGIDVAINTLDLTILPSTDGVTRVVCREELREPCNVSVENGMLKIDIEPLKWYQNIHLFSWGERGVTVYLAENELDTLTVNNSTSDIFVSSELSFGSATVKNSTGKVEFGASVRDALKITLSTGDALVFSKSLGSAEIKGTTGDVSMCGVIAQTLTVRVSTGEVDLSNVSCQSLSVKSSTGEQEYEDVRVAEAMALEASTGDISIENCTVGSAKITTDTGDVKGRFASEMIFFAKTNTGKVRVPQSTTGGACEITTNTGKIIFEAP